MIYAFVFLIGFGSCWLSWWLGDKHGYSRRQVEEYQLNDLLEPKDLHDPPRTGHP